MFLVLQARWHYMITQHYLGWNIGPWISRNVLDVFGDQKGIILCTYRCVRGPRERIWTWCVIGVMWSIYVLDVLRGQRESDYVDDVLWGQGKANICDVLWGQRGISWLCTWCVMAPLESKYTWCVMGTCEADMYLMCKEAKWKSNILDVLWGLRGIKLCTWCVRGPREIRYIWCVMGQFEADIYLMCLGANGRIYLLDVI